MPSSLSQLVSSQWQRVRDARADLRAARASSEQLVPMTADLHARLEECRHGLGALQAALCTIEERVHALDVQFGAQREERVAEHQRTMLGLRMVRDDDARSWNRLWELREEPEYELAYSEPDPLVTIVITTYSNWRLMRERALPSVIAQTYENWECLVVGDAAPPEAAEVVEAFGDERIRFVNLPYRGPYPAERSNAWLVSGTTPWNTALKLARGRWIGSVSDDDALVPTYVQSLLALARERRAELAYGQLRVRYPDQPDEVMGGGPPPVFGTWGTQCSLVHTGLTFIPLLHSDWVFSTPNDWSWAERLMRIGVRMAMVEEAVVDYYPSQLWNDRPPID